MVYLCLLILLLIRVAFITLLEQKLLAFSRLRVGPNFVGFIGLLQPFSDAVKLLSKELVLPYLISFRVFIFSPLIGFALVLTLWLSFPFIEGGFFFIFRGFFFICVSGLAVYPVLRAGWSSNCKYSILGRLRRVSQIISYEIRLIIIILRVFWVSERFKFNFILEKQELLWNIFLLFPLRIIWFLSSLAELNRTPYDFSEGESELVSGFNTEYGSGGFTIIFIREYARIIFIGFIFVFIFLGREFFSFFKVFIGVFLVFVFIWVRARFPRYRYDKLINLAWKRFLPLRLGFLLIYFRISYCY